MHRKFQAGFLAGLAVFFAGFVFYALHTAPIAGAAEAKTGTGLAEHALQAYDDGWQYRYGCYGQIIGGVHCSDCSGLIKSYLWWTGDKSNPRPGLCNVAGSSSAMLDSASVKGNINLSNPKSLPRIHGLILYSPGHVGVYVGGNQSVDNRCSGENMKKQDVIGGRYHWTKWFKLPQIYYPTKGFVTFEGNQYYYENGQYVVNTKRTIDGTVYTFDESGVMVSKEKNEPAKKSDTAQTGGSAGTQEAASSQKAS